MPAEPMLVDPLRSHARRRGDAVEVVLVLPEAVFARRAVTVRFQGDGVAVRTTGEAEELPDGGRRVVCLVPRGSAPDALPDGTWRLKLRVGKQAPLRPLRTRLVVAGDAPVALLPHFQPAFFGR